MINEGRQTEVLGLDGLLIRCLSNARLFYKQHFFMQRWATIWEKIKHKLINTLRLNFPYLKIYMLSSSTLSCENNSKNCTKSKYVCFNDVIWLITIKMRLKIKNRSQRYDINWPRPNYGHKYTKYKMCLSIMMVLCIKQHLSNIWSSIMTKLSNTEAELKKRNAYKKKSVIDLSKVLLQSKLNYSIKL